MKRLKWTSVLLLALMLAGSGTIARAGEVTGKVVAVYHEKVKTPANTFADQVSVTVADCNAGNRFVTLRYPPGALSEDNHLSFNFRHLATAARSTEQMTPFMNVVNGHATLAFNDQTKTVEKTTFWGHNWACGRNIDTTAPGGKPMGGAPVMPQQIQTAPKSNPVDALNPLRRFGGF